jgi:hypothetical protein
MSGSNRSVIARDTTGSSIVTGDHNTVTTTMKQVPLPPADQVDVKAELAALREALAALRKVPDRGKLDRAIEDAVEETAKPESDKQEIGGALERAVKYAKAAGDFTENAGKLLPPLTALASWLGPVGHGLPLPARPRLVMASNQFPIISRFRQINSRFGQINSRFRLTGIGA